jgi:hypothetical protein
VKKSANFRIWLLRTCEVGGHEFIEDRNTIRLEIVKIVNEELKKEETLDQEARKKIASQKKTVRRQFGVGHTVSEVLR